MEWLESAETSTSEEPAPEEAATEALAPESLAPLVPDAFTRASTVAADIVPTPVAVEHHDLNLAPPPVEQDTANEPAATKGTAVFELDNGALDTELAIETPESPISIFSLASSSNVPHEPDGASTNRNDGGDGWISHHDDEPAPVETPSVVDSLWDVEPELATDDSLQDLSSLADEINEPSTDEMFDTSIGFAPLDSDLSEYESDDELPLPDFTGVYDQTSPGISYADDESVPKSVEGSIGQVSARRAELDKLRPSEEEEETKAVAKEPAERTVMMQIVGVIFVGILAVLAVFLLDPAAVADLRQTLEGFLG